MEDMIADHTSAGMTDTDAPLLGFEYPKEPIISYAQTREDVLLWRALHNVHRGFYIDVGAHDPTALSVTRAFYDHGWHGINIEPNPSYAEKLRKERPRDVTLEVALGLNLVDAFLRPRRGLLGGSLCLVQETHRPSPSLADGIRPCCGGDSTTASRAP